MVKEHLEALQAILPDLEVAVYDPLIERRLHRWILDSPEDKLYARSRIAMGPWCAETTALGKMFLYKTLGGIWIRREAHVVDSWVHYILTLPTGDAPPLPEDLVVDPTYLQFGRERSVEDAVLYRPRIFIGSRLAIMQLVSDPEFSIDISAAQLYDPATIAKAY